MRAVKKGPAPKPQYHPYKSARIDLTQRLGWYCSYCEMPVRNMIEVEHVIPQKHAPHLATNWDNFLLACRYCNAVKSERNTSRQGYIWPDTHDSMRFFHYHIGQGVQTHPRCLPKEQQAAQSTIELTGLQRIPNSATPPTLADTRWRSRLDAWLEAQKAYQNWQAAPLPVMAKQIAATARGMGFYSVWCTVFSAVPEVLQHLHNAFAGTKTS